jgi:hypothetical protein
VGPSKILGTEVAISEALGQQSDRGLIRKYPAVSLDIDSSINSKCFYINLRGLSPGQGARTILVRCLENVTGDVPDDLNWIAATPSAISLEQELENNAYISGVVEMGENTGNATSCYWRCRVEALVDEEPDRRKTHRYLAMPLIQVSNGLLTNGE